jgi:hypothetical protein
MIHVLWCPDDQEVVLSPDGVALCDGCNTIMIDIGWIELDE